MIRAGSVPGAHAVRSALLCGNQHQRVHRRAAHEQPRLWDQGEAQGCWRNKISWWRVQGGCQLHGAVVAVRAQDLCWTSRLHPPTSVPTTMLRAGVRAASHL
jgi:hypothetical protein